MPTEHLNDFDEKLQTSFKRIVKEGIDMERMAMVISRDERQVCGFGWTFLSLLTARLVA